MNAIPQGYRVCVCVQHLYGPLSVASIWTFDDKAIIYSNLKTNVPKETYQGEASVQIYYWRKSQRMIKKTGHSEGLVVQAGFADGAVVKSPPANARNSGDVGQGAGSGRSPRGGHVNPLQSCLENPMDGGAWRGSSLWSCKELDMTE